VLRITLKEVEFSHTLGSVGSRDCQLSIFDFGLAFSVQANQKSKIENWQKQELTLPQK